MFQETAARYTRCEGKTLLLLTLLLGIAAFVSLSPAQQESTLNMVSTPYAMTMASQPTQSMRRPLFLQPQTVSGREMEPSRRGMIDGLAFAFAAALAHDKAAFAVTPMDLKDDRAAKKAGFDITYEARDLDLPQNVRDGMTQARSSAADTKKRVVESSKRLAVVLDDVKIAYWTQAGNELRRQVGTLRFDLNTLAGGNKAVLGAKKKFFADVETLDLAIREKKMEAALAAYDKVSSSLDAVLKQVL